MRRVPAQQTRLAGFRRRSWHPSSKEGEKPCDTKDATDAADASAATSASQHSAPPPAPANCDGPSVNEYSGSKDAPAPSTGNWGGTCTCPDGGVYDVSDIPGSATGEGCESLACHGGLPGKCNKYSGPWSGKLGG